MNHHKAARQATCRFWGVMGSGLLMVSGVTLAWILDSRYEPSMTILEVCVMMMQQFWNLAHRQAAGLSLANLLWLVFVASSIWAAGRTLVACWRSRGLLTHSQPYGHGRWPALDAALTILPAARQRLRILAISPPVACTVGLWRPQIVLSVGLIANLSPAELAAVVGHEWGHIGRRDPLRLALLRFWSDTLWYLPIVRALARDSARILEDAADDVAVVLTNQPLELAAALVKMAKVRVHPRREPLPALRGTLEVTERVERLLAVAPPRLPRRHVRAWTASAVVAIGLLGLLILPGSSRVTATPPSPFAFRSSMMACPMPAHPGQHTSQVFP